jgi:hypothetical protein
VRRGAARGSAIGAASFTAETLPLHCKETAHKINKSVVRTHLGDALEHLLLGHLVRCQLRTDNSLHLVHQLHIVLRDKAQRPALQPLRPAQAQPAMMYLRCLDKKSGPVLKTG